MDAQWEVRPESGISALRFGMTRAAVAALQPQLGPVVYENDLGAANGDDVATLMAPFSELFSPEDLAILRAGMAETAQLQQGMLLEHRGCGLVLTFQDDALAEIMAPCDGPPLHVGGISVFGAPRLEAVAALSRAAGDAPLTDGEHVAYRRAPLWLHSFMLGAPGFAPHPDRESAKQVSVTLRSGPMRGTAQVEWERFRPLPLPG